MKKSLTRKRAVLLAFALLIIGVGLSCFVWIHKEQNQYALNRSLIEALKKKDIQQALKMVNAGADPNTRFKQMPAPSWSELINQWLRHAPPPANSSSTALAYACGAVTVDEKKQAYYVELSDAELSPLVQAMLTHGANPNAKDGGGLTALHWLVWYHPNEEIAQQLLTDGADPNSASVDGTTPLIAAEQIYRPDLAMVAEQTHRTDLVALMRKYSKRR